MKISLYPQLNEFITDNFTRHLEVLGNCLDLKNTFFMHAVVCSYLAVLFFYLVFSFTLPKLLISWDSNRPGRKIVDDHRLHRLLQPLEKVGKNSLRLLLLKKTLKKVVYD